MKTPVNWYVLSILILSLTAAASAFATTRVLDFSTTGGTILDAQGEGTGFTTRLSGTGTGLAANDPNLDIDTAAGVLHITSTLGDINGQSGLPTLEFPGINLSELGFTGTQDFIVTATFSNVPDNTVLKSFDQLGLYVGRDSAENTQGMIINFDFFGNDNEFASRNIRAGVEANGIFSLAPTPSGQVTFTISRSAGVWTTQLAGSFGVSTKNPSVSPQTFLGSDNDLTAGVFVVNTADPPYMVDLDSFAVSVACPGDANGDCAVNMQDFIDISDNLFNTVPVGTMGDANLDGFVNYDDFRLWKNNFVPGSGAGNSESIPEPSVIVYVAIALAAFVCRRHLVV